MKIIFCHGKESGPYGTKYRKLKESFPDHEVISLNFQNLTLLQRVDKLNDYLDSQKEGCIVVGSSYGGATAVCAIHSRKNVVGVVLMAPALHRDEAPLSEALGRPGHFFELPEVFIIHGSNDDVIPVGVSQQFYNDLLSTSRTGWTSLQVTDDGHRLSRPESLQIMCDNVSLLLRADL